MMLPYSQCVIKASAYALAAYGPVAWVSRSATLLPQAGLTDICFILWHRHTDQPHHCPAAQVLARGEVATCVLKREQAGAPGPGQTLAEGFPARACALARGVCARVFADRGRCRRVRRGEWSLVTTQTAVWESSGCLIVLAGAALFGEAACCACATKGVMSYASGVA